jgi:hypothetical protein
MHGDSDAEVEVAVLERALIELHARTLTAAQPTGREADDLYPIHFAAGVLFEDGQVY